MQVQYLLHNRRGDHQGLCGGPDECLGLLFGCPC